MNRRRIALAVVVLVVLGVGAGLLLWKRGDGDEKAKPKTATTAPARDEVHARTPDRAAPEVEVTAPITLSPATVAEAPDAPSGELAGRVLNWGDNSPVAGAEVTIGGDAGVASFVTDANGQFVARATAPGRHLVISAIADGYLPWAPDADRNPLEIWSRPGVRIDGVVLYLVPALTYHGTVVDPDGAPVAGAIVTMLDAARGERAGAPIDDTFTTGADGKFDFHSPDNALFEARAEGFAPGRARLAGAAQISHELTITLGARGGSAPAPLAISGHVVDAAGKPIGGARVVANPAAELGLDGDATTDDAGAFTIAGLDAGPYGLRAVAEGYAGAAVAADAGATGVEIALEAGAKIVGRVVDPAGKPVPAPTIVVQQKAGLVSRAVSVISVFDAEGRFTVDGLAADHYEIVAQAAGYAPNAPVPAQAEADPDEIVVTLGHGATLVGTLIDGDTKAPLGNGKITVEGGVGEGSSAIPVVTTAITRDDGTFTLTGITPGRRSMTAGAYGHHLAIVGPYDVTEGLTIGPVAVELTALAPGEEPRIELAGIGARLTADGEVLRVDGVIEGGGAEKAGILAGDSLLAVDGTAVTELGLDGAIQRIRGPVGTIVTLRVQRGTAAASDIAVTRTKIRA